MRRLFLIAGAAGVAGLGFWEWKRLSAPKNAPKAILTTVGAGPVIVPAKTISTPAAAAKVVAASPSAVPTITPSAPIPTVTGAANTATVTTASAGAGGRLNLRATPDAKGAVHGTAEHGSIVTLNSTLIPGSPAPGWYLVTTAGGIQGYGAAEFLTVTPASGTS